MKFIAPLLVALVLLCSPLARADASQLWGDHGERWQPRGRLPDFSYAGYRAGRERIPRVPVVVNAHDFGARPGNHRDQTGEIQRALDAAARRGGGAVYLPRGKYRIEGKLKLNESGVVLRGAGPGDTTLFFVNSLKDLHGFDVAYANGESGLVQAGKNVGDTFKHIATVDVAAQRGDRFIVLKRDARDEGVSRGDVLRISMEPSNNDLSLWDHMHNDQNPNPDAAGAGSCDDARGRLGYWLGVVADVDGKRVTFDEPLRIDVRPQWNPRIELVRPVREVGVEDLRIEFERKPHKAHHDESGYNAIAFDEGAVVDAWIDNVRIHNADNGISLGTSKRVTVRDVRITADRDCSRTAGEGQFGCTTGHHGVKAGIDSLFDELTIDTNFIHELTFAERTSGSVCSRCGGSAKWSIDQHGRGQYENLVTQLRSAYDFEGGGGACRPEAGARNVLWGFQHAMRTPSWVGMQGTVVGDLAAGVDARSSNNGAWVENAPHVDNLYDAQLDRRLAVEDVGRFAEGPFGRRDAFVETNRDRFALWGEHYAIISTVHELPRNNALGARAIARTERLDDVEVTARARSTEPNGNGKADFALILGDDGDGRYYYALFTKQRDKSGIFKATRTDRVRLASVQGRGIDDDDWHRVSFARTGDRLVMKRDDRVLADVRDASLGAGRVGFGSLNDAALFDDIRVRVGDADASVLAPDVVVGVPSATEEPHAIDVAYTIDDAEDFPDEADEADDEGEAIAAIEAVESFGCATTAGAPPLLLALLALVSRRRPAKAPLRDGPERA
jgi:hypothetical protein